jgi:hypothetical protein
MTGRHYRSSTSLRTAPGHSSSVFPAHQPRWGSPLCSSVLINLGGAPGLLLGLLGGAPLGAPWWGSSFGAPPWWGSSFGLRLLFGGGSLLPSRWDSPLELLPGAVWGCVCRWGCAPRAVRVGRAGGAPPPSTPVGLFCQVGLPLHQPRWGFLGRHAGRVYPGGAFLEGTLVGFGFFFGRHAGRVCLRGRCYLRRLVA